MGKIFNKAKIISGYSKEEAEREYDVCRDRYTDDNVTEYKKFDMLSEAMLLSQRLMDLAKEEIENETARQNLVAFNKIFPDDKDRPAPNRYHTDGDGGCYDDFGTGLGGSEIKDLKNKAISFKWVWVPVLDDTNTYIPGCYEITSVYIGAGALPNFDTFDECRDWCDRNPKYSKNFK